MATPNTLPEFTSRDQREIDTLESRLATLRARRTIAVEVLVSVLQGASVQADLQGFELEMFIARADSLRDALEPFDSRVREVSQ